jgi:hypothetical protein
MESVPVRNAPTLSTLVSCSRISDMASPSLLGKFLFHNLFGRKNLLFKEAHLVLGASS